MSSNNGSNGRGPKTNPFYQPGQRGPKPFTPEEGCLTFVVGGVLLLISLMIWGIYYWWSNPEFHPERQMSPGRIATPAARTRKATPGLNP